jgi:hypothetical protein
MTSRRSKILLLPLIEQMVIPLEAARLYWPATIGPRLCACTGIAR